MITEHLTYPIAFDQPAFQIGSQILAIGDFDGVHLGHQQVIGRAVQTARSHHIPAAVMTFHPHPREVLGQAGYTEYLTPLDKKLELFEQMGVDRTYVVGFDLPFSKITSERFVNHIILPMQVNTVVVGFDFRFGNQALGTPDVLSQLSGGNYAVEVIRPFLIHEQKVSSTWIREELLAGRPDAVHELLGRPYALNGTVVHGEGRGRTIGFPTANLELSEAFLVPKNGVYAVRVDMNGRMYGGVMNIGVKPTFTDENKRALEVHIFDLDEELYGRTICVEFISFIRSERKFASVEALIQQIQQDAAAARNHFSAIT